MTQCRIFVCDKKGQQIVFVRRFLSNKSLPIITLPISTGSGRKIAEYFIWVCNDWNGTIKCEISKDMPANDGQLGWCNTVPFKRPMPVR